MTFLENGGAKSNNVCLNLGCWKFKIPGWVNVDIDPDFGDVHFDCRAIPYEDGSVACLYAGHLLEHVSPDDYETLFSEWKRVLRPGGRLTVTVPDTEKSLRMVKEGKMDYKLLIDVVYGWHDRPEQVHKMVFDEDILQRILCKHFNEVEILKNTPLAPYDVEWQTVATCVK
jgi:predicted SAM-dependent methyltransferase